MKANDMVQERKGNTMNDSVLTAVKVIKAAILKSQSVALRDVNKVQLSLYFGIGRYVSDNSRKSAWGTGAIASISERLQKELPGLRGFGERNIKNMRTFYEFWSPICSPTARLRLRQFGSRRLPNSNWTLFSPSDSPIMSR